MAVWRSDPCLLSVLPFKINVRNCLKWPHPCVRSWSHPLAKFKIWLHNFARVLGKNYILLHCWKTGIHFQCEEGNREH